MSAPDLQHVIPGFLIRAGSPAALQPTEGLAPLHDNVNTDGTSLGRIRPRPAARDLHEPGVAQTSLWPRMLPSAS